MSTTGTKLQNDRLEVIFYLTLLVTVAQAGFILWDLLTMLPGAGALVGLKEANKIHSSGQMSSLYLALLGIYAGYKEFVRWTSGAKDEEIPETQVKRFKRGEVIVAFWVVLVVLALTLWQMRLIARMPEELFLTALQSLAILFGSYASKSLHSRSKQKGGDSRINDDEARQKVLDYLKQNDSIDNETCQKLLGCNRFQAFRILEKLEREGQIQSQGTGKGSKYVLKSA